MVRLKWRQKEWWADEEEEEKDKDEQVEEEDDWWVDEEERKGRKGRRGKAVTGFLDRSYEVRPIPIIKTVFTLALAAVYVFTVSVSFRKQPDTLIVTIPTILIFIDYIRHIWRRQKD